LILITGGIVAEVSLVYHCREAPCVSRKVDFPVNLCYPLLGRMNDRQRTSGAKFLYDLAKGVALITLVSPWVTGQASWPLIALGTIWVIGLYLWAFWLEGDQP